MCTKQKTISEILKSTANFNPRTTTVDDCKIIQLPKINNPAGNITSANNHGEIPFNTKRVYYLYDVPGGEARGGHGHKQLQQLILAGSGSFDIIVNDGKNQRRFQLNRPDYGLYIPPGIWRELDNFSSGSISLVLASDNYEEEDYIRDFQSYKAFKKVTTP